MSWDYVEMNPLLGGTGSFAGSAAWTVESLDSVSVRDGSRASQADALQGSDLQGAVVATDPPYYDNIGYADLSDFFYVWLRRSLSSVYPDLLGTMLTPKSDELIATPYRFGGKVQAEQHFEEGFIRTFTRIRESHPHQVPIIVFYAFKQEERNDAGVASTGWETMLNGLAEAGLSVSATWPIATERASRSVDLGTNALASSIVLACRPRPASAEATTRRGFLQALKGELPRALREMQQGSIAPVDLAQAAIGPGMAVFTRYRSVLEADGSAMTVRTALALINAALDEVLFEQEGDFDPDTRFCVKWFTSFGWDEQVYGRALDLSLSTNTSVEGLVRGGIFWARAGRARLLPPDQLSKGWDPVTDERVSVWEVVVRLATVLADSGGQEAARLMALAGQRVDLDAAKELAYLLFSLAGKRGMTETALLMNGLGTSWSDVSSVAHAGGTRTPPPAQGSLEL